MVATSVETRGLIWRKGFRSVEALREALEEYGIWRSQLRVQCYGDATGAGEDPTPIDAPPSKYERIMQQNSEIDVRMEQLKVQAPHWWKIINAYYCSGLSVHSMGWIAAAEYCGLHHDPKSKHSRDETTFFEQLDVAVKKLWHTRVF